MSQRSGPIRRGWVLLSVCPRWMRSGGLARCPPGGTVLWWPSSQGPGSPMGRVAFGANAPVTGDCRSYLGATSLCVPCSCSRLVLQCFSPRIPMWDSQNPHRGAGMCFSTLPSATSGGAAPLLAPSGVSPHQPGVSAKWSAR